VEKLAGEVGGKVDFEVLLVGGGGEAKVGRPLVSGAAWRARFVAQGKHRKVIHFRKRRRLDQEARSPPAVHRGPHHRGEGLAAREGTRHGSQKGTGLEPQRPGLRVSGAA